MTDATARFGSDHIVRLLAQLGYEYVALNPGASFRGLHDSLVNQPDAPGIIVATHEEVAVAIAHGYAKASGRPMAAAIHDVVGLQHASMAIFNAFADGAPMLLLGGSGPADAAKRRPFIDWAHTALVQGNLVRDFVKWDDQPGSLVATLEAITRGHRVASSEPSGPVYVSIDSTIQEEDALAPPAFHAPAHPAASVLSPDPAAVETVAAWLVEADRPVAVVDMMGRDSHAVGALVQLSELLGMSVVDLGGRFNLPSAFPMNVLTDAEEVSGADVVLALDVVELHEPLRRLGALAPDGSLSARVINVSTRELGIRSWATTYGKLSPSDVFIPAAAGEAVRAILEACRRRPRPAAAAERVEEAAVRQQRRREAWREEAEATAGDTPIARAWLTLVLGRAIEGHRWALVNDTIEHPWPRRLWSFERPEQWLGGSGGGGMGYGIGASVGAALALAPQGILPVDIQGDGDLLYAPGAIWSAVHHRIPLLIVVFDNRAYHNSRGHALKLAEQRGRPPERAEIGTTLDDPPIDLAALARSMGAAGYGPIADPSEVEAVLERAVKDVSAGGVALVDVVSEAR
jgi:thiamine pyrophosphate-dependent acetolactate synthase large subunit-like protein